ncbi:unnamed protein product [Paramecium octaurelia]|uniref:Uncharacterized protein n=1 Tax=Paramecium octaurelia TaxID=43137 RepID=A0A8S1TV39_PAROT|nr:unnamed protein product [Paramecium octaurelia]
MFNKKQLQRIVICGDFIHNNVRFDQLANIIEQSDLKFTRTIQGKVVQSLLDSICYPGQEYSEKNLLFTKLSDHPRIYCQLTLQGVQNQKEQRVGWSKSNAYNLNQEAALKCNDFQTWYNYVRYNLRKRQAIKKIRVTIPYQAKGKQTIEEQLMKSAILFNQPNLKKAFQNIKRMATLNPSKKKLGSLEASRMIKIISIFIQILNKIYYKIQTEFLQRSVYQTLTPTNLPPVQQRFKSFKNSYHRNLVQVSLKKEEEVINKQRIIKWYENRKVGLSISRKMLFVRGQYESRIKIGKWTILDSQWNRQVSEGINNKQTSKISEKKERIIIQISNRQYFAKIQLPTQLL